MTMDMSRYLGLFISEATEHLEALGRDLVELEREATASTVDSMFRHAHSVKGMASSMGFEPIAMLAHRVEDLVDAVRQDRKLLDRDLVDLLLNATDTLTAQVRAVSSNREPEQAEGLLKQLSARVQSLTGHAPAATRVAQVNALKPATPSGGDDGEGSGGGEGPSGASGSGTPGGSAGPAPGSGTPGSAAGALGAGAPGSGTQGGAAGASASGAGAAGAGASASGASASGGVAPSTPGASESGTAAPAASSAAVPSALAVMPPATLMPPRDLSGPDALYGAPGARSLAVVPESDPSSSVVALASGLKAVTSVADGKSGAPRWSVRLRISPTCQVPGVRAFLVHKRLSSLGTLVDLRPPLEELKAGRIPDGYIQVDVETGVGDAGIQAALRNVAEVEVVSVAPAVPEPPVLPVVAPASDPARATADAGSRTVRVRTELLDYFLDTVGELMLATARLREVGKVLPENTRPALEEGVYRLHTLVKDLHDKVMSARMTPLSLITDRLPRAARDLARRKEREVELVITGAEIELDRAILDELADPLLHLLRNCIDHGLESPEERTAAKKSARGRVTVTVRRARDRVIIDIEDDGRGMDPAKLKASALKRGLITEDAAQRMADRDAFLLSCLPGVSTAKDITDISGRGVGMDAVKRVVESVGGTLEIDSERGRGTTFTLRLPLTVAVVHLLLVEVGEEVFGLPIAKVVGATEADPESLSRSRETALLPHGNGLLPVHALEALLGVPATPRPGYRPFVVMEGDAGTGKVALAVDRLLGQEEVVLKPLSRPLDLLPGLSGVTILGSGRPVFILDVPRLLTA
ncbi:MULTISPECIES: chemotaxis protein CheA [unclassified Corallococcus]|uniref:chemotaxis protein CheA n=1 Tax=unclassified Corallococcus TaxID=2685029 RepID=UPI001A8D7A2A|nr:MULTISPECIES: chemotaxis protein CheA [unclassified Corallococcus]MBN9682215.1 chemotaxis protein CheA [Corallococcus sp. NCSPR001]WAS86225.1 chemotaxis protein CheA [Corallococcus sp. NCRR]